MRALLLFLLVFAALFVAPVVYSAAEIPAGRFDWRTAPRHSARLSPLPADHPGAIVQVMGARTVGWRGAVGEHTWIVTKRSGATSYNRYEVIGWGVERGIDAIRVNRAGPDDLWFGAQPKVYADRRGDGVDAVIDRIERAVASYPYPGSYRVWPGPNSNTFTAHIARQVPELDLDLPPTAIGKDFLPGTIAAATPSGSGFQVSLFGLLGVTAALNEGLEVNLLGLTVGVDVREPAVKLPGIGRVDFGW
jgi:hypothetical protein